MYLLFFSTVDKRCRYCVAANLFFYQTLDPSGVFMWISVHHIVQTVAALPLLFLIHKLFYVDFMLKPCFSKKGIVYSLLHLAFTLL